MSIHVPLKTYYQTFGALIVLTALTVGIAIVDLGAGNTIAALAIACFKATLVILFFMHVRYGSRLIWLFVGSAFYWLGIMLILTMTDVLTRDWLLAVPGR